MCGYLFETFPSVHASCSTFYLLVCSRVSYRRRGSEVLSHAVQLKYSFFSLSFFDTWQIINGGLAALRRSMWANTPNKMFNSTSYHRYKSPFFKTVFTRLFHHSSRLWLWFEERSWLHLSNKI